MSPENYFDLAHRLADLASDRSRKALAQGFASERKLDKTWVTEADVAIEREIRDHLAREAPGTRVLGEEEGGAPLVDGDELTWILDPIDGTFSFVHGIPFYSSLLALYRGREPVLGVACLPGLGVKMSALRGKGAFIGTEPYSRSRFVGAPQVEVVATADPYRFRMEGCASVQESLYGDRFKARTYPDALGYWLLLGGHVRAFVDPKVEVWDVAPFHCILAEAGFAIHPWHDAKAGLQRGTSVAYPLDAVGLPLAVDDVLSLLASTR
jgi:fructose-1,6-bisphosphatase/inositol monophosphatase family enzyme